MQVTVRAARVGAGRPHEAIGASERDATGGPGSGGVLWATNVEELGRTGSGCDGSRERVWTPSVNGSGGVHNGPGGGRLQRIQRC